jgi:hypothetical protein
MKIKEVEMNKITISFFIKEAKIKFKKIQPIIDTTTAIKNLNTLYAKNKSFIVLLYHKGNK